VKELIVNADDLGRCRRVNAGIARAHEHGIVTSASLMVRWPTAQAAADWARERATIGLGLHLDLGEWAYGGGAWPPVYEVVALDDPDAVEAEARAQVDRFRQLVGTEPTHLDSHQHVHHSPPVAAVVDQLGDELDIPVRGRRGTVRHCGDFYGRTRDDRPLHAAITADHLVELVTALADGVTELACHPGEGTDTPDAYDAERRLELAALCAPAVRDAIEREGVTLRSFDGLRDE
jgi:chitin disaccharide deacetylase